MTKRVATYTKRRWTVEETHLLRRLVRQRASTKTIAGALRRPPTSVRRMACRLRLRRPRPPRAPKPGRGRSLRAWLDRDGLRFLIDLRWRGARRAALRVCRKAATPRAADLVAALRAGADTPALLRVALGVGAAWCRRLLARLERDGLVTRERKRRLTRYRLTEAPPPVREDDGDGD